MKKFVSCILAVLLACSTAACSSGGEQSSEAASRTGSSSGSNVTLRVAWWGSQARHDATLKVLDLYTQKTGVKFEAEYMPFDGYFTKLNTLVASNDLYDVFQLGSNFVTYKDHIQTLDDYISDKTIDTSNIEESYLKTTQYQGKEYGISLGINTYGIAYDPALFQKAGLKEPAENWTWTEFENDCMTIKKKLNIFGSSKMDDWVAGVSQLVPQNNEKEQIFNEKGSALGYTDDKPIANYLAMKKRLVKAKAYPDPGECSEIKDIEGDFLVTGDAAMTWVASNQFIALSKAAGRTLKLAADPRINADGFSGNFVQSSQMFSISKNSKNAKEAAKFLSFFVNDVDANQILKGERGVPISSKVRADLESSQSESEKEVYNFVDMVGKNSTVMDTLDPPHISEIKDLYSRLHNQVVTGELDSGKAASQFRSNAATLLKQSS